MRPGRLLSMTVDAALGIVAYLASYWLRFHQQDQLAAFLPVAWATTPLIVAGQLAMLTATRAYARKPRVSWLFRVTAGTVLGTVVSSVLIAAIAGFEGVSRAAFAADAILFTIAALSWRGLWIVSARARARTATDSAKSGELIDRAAELTTFKGVVVSLYSTASS